MNTIDREIQELLYRTYGIKNHIDYECFEFDSFSTNFPYQRFQSSISFKASFILTNYKLKLNETFKLLNTSNRNMYFQNMIHNYDFSVFPFIEVCFKNSRIKSEKISYDFIHRDIDYDNLYKNEYFKRYEKLCEVLLDIMNNKVYFNGKSFIKIKKLYRNIEVKYASITEDKNCIQCSLYKEEYRIYNLFEIIYSNKIKIEQKDEAYAKKLLMKILYGNIMKQLTYSSKENVKDFLYS